MRPTFMGFETAKSGLNVSQKALDIVGNNLSNIDTPGYTRQRVDSTSIAPSSFTTRVASSRVGLAGQGVEALGVSQTRDAFLDKRFRDEYASASYYTQSTSILTDLQSALGDANNVSLGGDVLAQAIRQVYQSLNDFTGGESTSTPHANLVLSAFNNMTQVIQMIDSKLNSVADQQKFDLGVSVDNVNTILEKIAHLNNTISGDATVLQDPDNEYFRPNELLDQRNLLLDELAGYGNISVTTLKDGTINVTMGGHQVVSGGTFDNISVQDNADTGVVSLKWRSSGELLNLSGGSLLGYTDFINGRGANMQNPGETNKQGVLYYKDRLNTLARTMANTMNNTIPEMEEVPGTDPDAPPVYRQKLDENGNLVFKTLISAKQLNGTTNDKEVVTAANIAVSDHWTNGGAEYFISQPGNLTNSDYALQLAYALTEKNNTFVSFGETFKGTFEEYLIDYTGKIGSDTQFYSQRQTVTSTVADDLLNRRDSISGVSENEETVSMMTYQKSFSAISRLMTTLDDVLDVLINRTGRAGL